MAKQGQNRAAHRRTEQHISNISITYHQQSIMGPVLLQEAFYSVVEGCRGCRDFRWSSERLRITSLCFSEGAEPLVGLRRGSREPHGAS